MEEKKGDGAAPTEPDSRLPTRPGRFTATEPACVPGHPPVLSPQKPARPVCPPISSQVGFHFDFGSIFGVENLENVF
jgi:hypothetical protein